MALFLVFAAKSFKKPKKYNTISTVLCRGLFLTYFFLQKMELLIAQQLCIDSRVVEQATFSFDARKHIKNMSFDVHTARRDTYPYNEQSIQ